MSVIAKIKCVVVVAVLFIGSAACEPVSGGEVPGPVAGLPGQEQPLPAVLKMLGGKEINITII